MRLIKLLIVEDETILADQTEDFLDIYPILKIVKANTGEEAMEIISKDRPDIIILDLKLGDFPAMDGMTVFEKLRKLDDRKTDVIVMTALEDDSFEIGCKKLGAKAYLRKPFSSSVLRDEVAKVLKERGAI